MKQEVCRAFRSKKSYHKRFECSVYHTRSILRSLFADMVDNTGSLSIMRCRCEEDQERDQFRVSLPGKLQNHYYVTHQS